MWVQYVARCASGVLRVRERDPVIFHPRTVGSPWRGWYRGAFHLVLVSWRLQRHTSNIKIVIIHLVQFCFHQHNSTGGGYLGLARPIKSIQKSKNHHLLL
jgi:hypothetical protein